MIVTSIEVPVTIGSHESCLIPFSYIFNFYTFQWINLPLAVRLHHNIGFPEIHQQIFLFSFTLPNIAEYPIPFILWNIRWKTFLNFSLIHSVFSHIRSFHSTDEIIFTWEINYHKRQWWHIASTSLAWRCAQKCKEREKFVYLLYSMLWWCDNGYKPYIDTNINNTFRLTFFSRSYHWYSVWHIMNGIQLVQ